MAELIKIYEKDPNEKMLERVVEVLKNDGLIIFPTDTVYSLGCDISSQKALRNLAQIKGVKLEKANFSFITNTLSNLSHYVKSIDTPSYKLLKRALPGPYTFIMNGVNKLPKPFIKKKTVGIRIPDNPIVNEIVRLLGNPIAVTSLKDSDEVLEYTTDPEIIFEKWEHKVDMVIDGGFGGNIPSTIIDITGIEPVVLREGKGSLEVL